MKRMNTSSIMLLFESRLWKKDEKGSRPMLCKVRKISCSVFAIEMFDLRVFSLFLALLCYAAKTPLSRCFGAPSCEC